MFRGLCCSLFRVFAFFIDATRTESLGIDASSSSTSSLAGRALPHAHRFRRRGQHIAAVDDLHQRQVPDRERDAHDACRIRREERETDEDGSGCYESRDGGSVCVCVSAFCRSRAPRRRLSGDNDREASELWRSVRVRDAPVMMAVICAPFTSSSSLSSGKDSSSGAGAGAGVSSSSAARSAGEPRRCVARKNEPEGARLAGAHETRALAEARGGARAPAATTAVRETAKDMLRARAGAARLDSDRRVAFWRIGTCHRRLAQIRHDCSAAAVSRFPVLGEEGFGTRVGVAHRPARSRGTHSRARLFFALGVSSEGIRPPLPFPRPASRGGPSPPRKRTADTSLRLLRSARATPWRTGTTATGTRC